MLKYFSKQNAKWMGKLGRESTVYLLAYPERTLDNESGLSSYGKREVTVLERAIMVPLPVERSRGHFGEQLVRTTRGEYMTGDVLLYVDEDWLNSQDIVIDTQLDRVEWDGDQYKIMKYGKFSHYHRVGIYLCIRIAEAHKD